jgi:hypothetical protein
MRNLGVSYNDSANEGGGHLSDTRDPAFRRGRPYSNPLVARAIYQLDTHQAMRTAQWRLGAAEPPVCAMRSQSAARLAENLYTAALGWSYAFCAPCGRGRACRKP